MHLHGNMSQPRRLAIYEEFCSKQSAILLATDLAARGLDFPKVDWVLQLDCPEDPQTYIHRYEYWCNFLSISSIYTIDDLLDRQILHCR